MTGPKPTSLPSHPLDSRLDPLRGRRSRRLQGPDAVEWRLEIETGDAKWLTECFPSGALVFANNGFGDYLYLANDSGEIMVFWHEGHLHEIYCANVEDLLPNKKRPPSDHGPVRYFGSEDQVLPGDRVFVKYWLLFKSEGTVVYVPGISPLRRELERDGLSWVRASLDRGVLIDLVILDGVLKKGATLLSRRGQRTS